MAEEIRELFPSIAATERLKVRQQRSSDGRATLGAARLERLEDFRIIREIGRGADLGRTVADLLGVEVEDMTGSSFVDGMGFA